MDRVDRSQYIYMTQRSFCTKQVSTLSSAELPKEKWRTMKKILPSFQSSFSYPLKEYLNERIYELPEKLLNLP